MSANGFSGYTDEICSLSTTYEVEYWTYLFLNISLAFCSNQHLPSRHVAMICYSLALSILTCLFCLLPVHLSKKITS